MKNIDDKKGNTEKIKHCKVILETSNSTPVFEGAVCQLSLPEHLRDIPEEDCVLEGANCPACDAYIAQIDLEIEINIAQLRHERWKVMTTLEEMKEAFPYGMAVQAAERVFGSASKLSKHIPHLDIIQVPYLDEIQVFDEKRVDIAQVLRAAQEAFGVEEGAHRVDVALKRWEHELELAQMYESFSAEA